MGGLALLSRVSSVSAQPSVRCWAELSSQALGTQSPDPWPPHPAPREPVLNTVGAPSEVLGVLGRPQHWSTFP